MMSLMAIHDEMLANDKAGYGVTLISKLVCDIISQRPSDFL